MARNFRRRPTQTRQKAKNPLKEALLGERCTLQLGRPHAADDQSATMSLWVDKYRPNALDKLDYHPDVTDQLRKLVRDKLAFSTVRGHPAVN